ncbi:hypothetical protein P8452_35813 [Trifolium repens]|nr:hypothetical protein P8452_35813 [Trifolium repens]
MEIVPKTSRPTLGKGICMPKYYIKSSCTSFSWCCCWKFPKNPRLPSVRLNLKNMHLIPLLWGTLDFDDGDARQQPPVDTTWQQIYFCLRSGYYDEPRNVALSSRF